MDNENMDLLRHYTGGVRYGEYGSELQCPKCFAWVPGREIQILGSCESCCEPEVHLNDDEDLLCTIKGRYVPRQGETTYGEYTIGQIQNWLRDGYYGMMSMSQYVIDGLIYPASGLTISQDHGIPEIRDDHIVVPAHFRRELLGHPHQNAGQPTDLVRVEAIVGLDDEQLFVTICEPTVKRLGHVDGPPWP